MLNILLVDDHQIVIDGLKQLIHGGSEFKVSHEALTGTDAIKIASDEEVDLILLDINLPDKSGFEVCKTIKDQHPDIKIIALTMHGEAGFISKMIKMGVDGYILKNAGKEIILDAIKTVMNGKRYFSEEVTESLLSRETKAKRMSGSGLIQKLTRREKEILKLVIEELTTDEIAEKLFISSTTVISHRKSLLRKLNAKNTAGLVKAAYEYRLLDDN